MAPLLQLILQHKDAFTTSVQQRESTSTANKGLHQLMLDRLSMVDLKGIQELLDDDWYQKPLQGVIICMCGSLQDVKSEMLDAMEEES